jgi:hypothetical protein
MDEIVKIILSGKRRRFLLNHPIYKLHQSTSEARLFRLATELNFKFTLELSKWLRLAGYGNIDEALIFREEYFSKIDGGPLGFLVTFARDPAGNHFAFSLTDGTIYLVRQPDLLKTRLSDSFTSFLQELIRRDYQLNDWISDICREK